MFSEERPNIVLVNRCFVIRDDGLILAIQRSVNDSHNPGQWEVPGGKLDAGEDLQGALEREVFEETGYQVRAINRMAHYESKVLGKYKQYTNIPYVVLFGLADMVSGKQKLSKEHDDAKWCTRSAFKDLDLTYETRKAVISLENRLSDYGVR